MSLVGPSKPTVIVRFCPLLFELRKIPRKVPLKQSGKYLVWHTATSFSLVISLVTVVTALMVVCVAVLTAINFLSIAHK